VVAAGCAGAALFVVLRRAAVPRTARSSAVACAAVGRPRPSRRRRAAGTEFAEQACRISATPGCAAFPPPVAGRGRGPTAKGGAMAYVLIEHLVGDYETFEKVYLDDGERRRRSGSRGGRVFRAADDPNDIIILLEWDDAQHARQFAGSLELHEAMHWSTSNVATPRVTVLEHIMDSEA
jgi:hypothetical protein